MEKNQQNNKSLKTKFKRALLAIMCLTTAIGCCFGLSACNNEKNILVISREDGSGTRDAFDSLIKDESGASLAKDASGSKYSESPIVKSAEFLSKTGDVITKVSSTKTAMGYISLGSLNDSVKALKVENVTPSSATVLDGTYKLKRPFVIINSATTAPTAAAADFIKYLKSSQAQDIVKSEKYVEQASNTTYTAPTTALSGKIIIKGSTSVDKLMDGLIANYKTLGKENVSQISFEKDAQGSSYGLSAVKADTDGNVIGMSSSAIKAADAPKFEQITLALDAVAIVVNNDNAIENVSIAQLFKIYTGAITKFSDIK